MLNFSNISATFGSQVILNPGVVRAPSLCPRPMVPHDVQDSLHMNPEHNFDHLFYLPPDGALRLTASPSSDGGVCEEHTTRTRRCTRILRACI